MKKDIVRIITSNAIVAAIYFLFTLITSPFSFLGMQVRVAEVFVLLCFFRKDYCFGITLGCLLVNIISPLGAWDMLFGTLATLVSCLFVMYSKHLVIAAIFPIIFNSFIVGAELFFILNEPFWINVGMVAIGETIAMILGYILFFALRKQSSFKYAIRIKQNENFKW